jgi:hypothetical protein
MFILKNKYKVYPHYLAKSRITLSINWSIGGLISVESMGIILASLFPFTFCMTHIAHGVQVPQHAQQHPQQVNGMRIAATHCTKQTA